MGNDWGYCLVFPADRRSAVLGEFVLDEPGDGSADGLSGGGEMLSGSALVPSDEQLRDLLTTYGYEGLLREGDCVEIGDLTIWVDTGDFVTPDGRSMPAVQIVLEPVSSGLWQLCESAHAFHRWLRDVFHTYDGFRATVTLELLPNGAGGKGEWLPHADESLPSGHFVPDDLRT